MDRVCLCLSMFHELKDDFSSPNGSIVTWNRSFHRLYSLISLSGGGGIEVTLAVGSCVTVLDCYRRRLQLLIAMLSFSFSFSYGVAQLDLVAYLSTK